MKRNYHVKFLNEKDVELAEAVCTASEDYYLMEQDKPASKSDAIKNYHRNSRRENKIR